MPTGWLVQWVQLAYTGAQAGRSGGRCAGVVPTLYNKHVFITGRRQRLQVRPVQE